MFLTHSLRFWQTHSHHCIMVGSAIIFAYYLNCKHPCMLCQLISEKKSASYPLCWTRPCNRSARISTFFSQSTFHYCNLMLSMMIVVTMLAWASELPEAKHNHWWPETQTLLLLRAQHIFHCKQANHFQSTFSSFVFLWAIGHVASLYFFSQHWCHSSLEQK